MKSLYAFLITKILGWLHGVTAEQFDAAKNYVTVAEEKFTKTEDKWLFVKRGLQALYPQLRASAVNLLIELAVGWLTKAAK